MVSVGDLSPELDVPVPLERLRDGVQVDHELDGVAGAFVAGLGVDDDGFVFTVGNDVGPTGQRRRLAAEFKPVLRFDVHVVAADFPVSDAFVDEGGVVQQPLGLVEVRRLADPTPSRGAPVLPQPPASLAASSAFQVAAGIIALACRVA